MMKAPLRPGTRPVGAAQLAVEEYTSTDGPEFAATPEGDGPRAAPRPARRRKIFFAKVVY